MKNIEKKKVTQRNSSKLTTYIPNEYTFRRKKLVRSLIFEMKLAYYILWLVLAKLNQHDQSVKTIAHNTNAKHMLKNWGKKFNDKSAIFFVKSMSVNYLP